MEVHKETRKMGVKGQSSLYNQGYEDPTRWIDGNCDACGDYDSELEEAMDGRFYCRSEECKGDRFIKAIKEGRAGKNKDGSLYIVYKDFDTTRQTWWYEVRLGDKKLFQGKDERVAKRVHKESKDSKLIMVYKDSNDGSLKEQAV